MNFDPYSHPFKNSRIHRESNFQSGSSFGSVKIHSLTLSYNPGSMKCEFRASFLACTFVSLCFDCKPKDKVTTLILMSTINLNYLPLLQSYLHHIFFLCPSHISSLANSQVTLRMTFPPFSTNSMGVGIHSKQ